MWLTCFWTTFSGVMCSQRSSPATWIQDSQKALFSKAFHIQTDGQTERLRSCSNIFCLLLQKLDKDSVNGGVYWQLSLTLKHKKNSLSLSMKLLALADADREFLIHTCFYCSISFWNIKDVLLWCMTRWGGDFEVKGTVGYSKKETYCM